MCSSKSKRMSSSGIVTSRGNLRSDLFALDHTHDIPLFLHVKDHERELALHQQGNRRQVHHAKLVAVHLLVGDLVKELGVGLFFGVGGVNPVDLCRFENNVGLNFGSAQ